MMTIIMTIFRKTRKTLSKFALNIFNSHDGTQKGDQMPGTEGHIG